MTIKNTTTAVETATETREPRLVPLSQLDLSPLNPRQNVSDDAVAALADSIRTVGLMQNLAGIETEAGRVEIVAGGRRLRALQLITSEDGGDDFEVPVILATDEAEAQAWASTENIAREALHPADEVAAYRDMAASGAAPDAIAKAFGVTVRHVKGRLKLAVLADPILAALRADEITLDIAAAYTICDDPERQTAAFEKVHGTWNESEHTIRSMLTEDAAEDDNRLAVFVGREAYEAAGGAISENLFGDEVYFLDGDVLAQLAQEKLEDIAASYRADGWKWVEAGFDQPDYQVTQAMGRTYPSRIEATEEEAARYDELAALNEGAQQSDDEECEFHELSMKLDAEHFSAEQMEHAGMFIWIGYHGDIQTREGMILTEDRPAAEAAGVCKPNQHGQSASASETVKEKPMYSTALAEDLARIRTGAVQAALLEKPELALELLTFALTAPVYSGSLPLGISSTDAQNGPKDGEGMKLPKAIQPEGYGYPMNGKEAAEAFTAFRRRKPATRAKLLTEAVAKIVSVGLAGDKANPFRELVAELAETDVRRNWTPTEAFLKRLTGAQLEAAHAEIMGEVQGSFIKLKKGEKASRLHRIFAGEKGIPPLTDAQKARAAAWVPQGLVAQPAEDKPAETGAKAA